MSSPTTVEEYLQQDWTVICSDLAKIDSKLRTSSDEKYTMLQYGDKCHSLGMTPIQRALRGAVVDTKTRKIVSRTYSVPTEIDSSNISLLKDIQFNYLIKIQSLYDGTMLRLSYFNDKWNLLTNGKFSAYESIWRNSKSFGKYFDEFITNSEQFCSSLDREYTYIFVFCHPDNTIVVNYEQPTLHLVAKINNESGREIDAEPTLDQYINISPVKYHLIPVSEAIDNALTDKVKDGYIFIQTYDLYKSSTEINTKLGSVNTRYRLQSTVYSVSYTHLTLPTIYSV